MVKPLATLHALLCITPLFFLASPVGTQVVSEDEGLEAAVVVELNSADAQVVPSLQQSVLRPEDGDYLVSHLFADPAFVVYSPDGDVQSVYDQTGDGPGELGTFPHLFAGPEGSVNIWERDRLHRFDPSLNHQRTTRLRHRIWSTAALLPGGGIVVDDRFGLESGDSATVSVLDATGALERVVEQESAPVARPRIAPAPDGGFWTLSQNDTRISRYSSTAELQHSVRIEGGIVEPWTERVEGEGTTVAPRPRHEGLADQGDGTLLVVSWVADAEWEPTDPTDDLGGLVPTELDSNPVFDSVVERVDGDTGEVLGSIRVPYPLQPVHGGPEFFHSRHPAPLGHVVTRIWRVTPVTATPDARTFMFSRFRVLPPSGSTWYVAREGES